MLWPLWRIVRWFLRKSIIGLPYDPAISLLVIYPKELKARTPTDIWTPIFIAALFTIAKMCKQSKCPSLDEWTNKM